MKIKKKSHCGSTEPTLEILLPTGKVCYSKAMLFFIKVAHAIHVTSLGLKLISAKLAGSTSI